MVRSFRMCQNLLRHPGPILAVPGSVWAGCSISRSSGTLWEPRICHIHPHQQALVAHKPHDAHYGELDPSQMCPAHPACLVRLSVARAMRTRTSLVRVATVISSSDDRAWTYPGDPQASSRSRHRIHTRPTTAYTFPLARESCTQNPPNHAPTTRTISLALFERCSLSSPGLQLGRTTINHASR